MEGSLIIGGILLVGFLVYQLLDLPKTLLAIAWVNPYEQEGSGAGGILVIGDSTGYGTGANRAEDSIAGRIGQDFPGYRIKNNSENGRKIAEAREVVEGIESQYDLILFQIGANDLLAGVPIETVVADILALVEAAEPHAEHIIVMTSGNIGGAPRFTGEREEYFQTVSKQYTSMMKDRSASAGFVFIDLYKDPTEDVFVAAPEQYIAADGLHPTSAGYGVWYQRLQPELEILLAE
jgi:lysophospholipase L1-like esterase